MTGLVVDKPGHEVNLIENVRPLFRADSKTCQSFRFAFEATPSGLRVGVAVGESVPFKRGGALSSRDFRITEHLSSQ